MKILGYQIEGNDLIVCYENTNKVISNFADRDLILVLLEMLQESIELKDVAKERECLISLLNIKLKNYSLEELRARCLEEGVISNSFLLGDNDYLKFSLEMQTVNYKTRVRNKKFLA